MIKPLVALGWTLGVTTITFGQAQEQVSLDRFERQLEQIQRSSRLRIDDTLPAADRALLDYGGYLSFNFLSLDDQDGHSHVLRQWELVGYGRINFDGAHEFFVRGRTVFNDYNRGDAFDGRGDDWDAPVIERAHYRFDLQRSMAAYGGKVIDENVIVQGGRQLVTWGNGLVLSEVIDGGTVALSKGPFTVDLVGGVTYNENADFDISRPDFRDDTDRGVFGGMISANVGVHRFYAYGLAQLDYNGLETRTTGPVTTRFDYDSYYIGLGASGALRDDILYAVEASYEGGHTLSNSFDPVTTGPVKQTDDDIQAWALDARLDYVFADQNRSRLNAELILASGDSDRGASNSTLNGNAPGSKDHSFNSLGLLNTGLAFAPTVSNLAMVRVGGSTFPFSDTRRFRQLQIGADFLVFNKMVADAPIDEPTGDQHFLGTEADLTVNWQITSDLTLAVRYGVFFPNAAIDGDSSARNFVFAGLTYAF